MRSTITARAWLSLLFFATVAEACAAVDRTGPAAATVFVAPASSAVAASAGVLSGTVVSATPDRAGVSNAVVFLRREDAGGGSWRARSVDADPTGRFVFAGLAAGYYDLAARAGSRIGVTSRAWVVTTSGGWAGIEIAVSPGAKLKGAVLDEEGRPFDAAEVAVVREGDFEWAADAETGSNGVFLLDGLFPGRYSIRTRMAGVVTAYADVDVVGTARTAIIAPRRPAAPPVHAVAPPAREGLARPFRAPPPTSLEGIGVDESGRPISDFSVYLKGKWSQPPRLIHDPNGIFGFTGFPPDPSWLFGDEPSGRVAALRIAVDPSGKAEPVRLVFRNGVRVVGRIVDVETRRPLRAAVELDIGDSTVWRGMWTRQDGSFSLDGVPLDVPCTLSVLATNGVIDFWTFRSSSRPGRIDDAGTLELSVGGHRGHDLKVSERSGR